MKIGHILKDRELYDEISSRIDNGELTSPFPVTMEARETRTALKRLREGVPTVDFHTESIVRRTGRPVMLVRGNTFEPPQSEVWRDRLEPARAAINQAILATGRVEVREHPKFSWLGTAWLVAEDLIVTNRHVATEFARKDGGDFVFKRNFLGRQMIGRIDFREEFGHPDQEEFRIVDTLHIEEEDGYDMAFFRVEGNITNRTPISLASGTAANRRVAVIGYPAKDSRIPDETLMEKIYGDIYDVKRLAPGEVMDVLAADAKTYVRHDCTTLGGNSGSVAFDYAHGQAVGLHFGGNFLDANYAVPANIVAQRLAAIR